MKHRSASAVVVCVFLTFMTIAVGSCAETAKLTSNTNSSTAQSSGAIFQITTTSLPAPQFGVAYHATLLASGGTLPYTWSLASGSLPNGIALQSTTGVVSGTPTAAGLYTFTLQAVDASLPQQAVTAMLTLSVSSGALKISTTALTSGTTGQAYNSSLMAVGGVPPYLWTLKSGLFPTGLGITLLAGTIAGIPIQSGQFTVSLQAADSALPLPHLVTKSFTINIQNSVDEYGGFPSVPCPSGAAAYFYTQKISNQWWLCTPAGNGFWMKGVYAVDTDNTVDFAGVNYADVAAAKYGDANLTWGPQQNLRLKSWGFNTLAEYSSLYVLPTTTESEWPGGQQPVPMPFTALAWPSWYALLNSGNYASGPVKELIQATNPAVFTGYRGRSPDIWDPNFGQWLDGFLQHDWEAPQWINGPNNSYLIGINVDDTDTLEGFGAGSDFKTVTDGVASGGREQPHLGWIILITPPTQSQNTALGLTYSDSVVYSKLALMNFLQARYATIDALNASWSSAYTSFGSDGGWGVGAGLLDEDGAHAWVPKDCIGLSDANAGMKKDMNDFLFLHAQKYFSTIRSILNARAPGRLYLGPTTMSTWGSPPRKEILEAAASYVDVFSASSIPSGASDDQQRIDFIAQYLGDKPWLEWEGFAANPDSYMYSFPADDTVQAQSSTQYQRGQIYSTMVSKLVHARTSSGTYPVAGFKWWQYIDNRGEQMNWGLVTRRDNAYDGRAAVMPSGLDAWGFPTGGEIRNFSNFLSAVQTANFTILTKLAAR